MKKKKYLTDRKVEWAQRKYFWSRGIYRSLKANGARLGVVHANSCDLFFFFLSSHFIYTYSVSVAPIQYIAHENICAFNVQIVIVINDNARNKRSEGARCNEQIFAKENSYINSQSTCPCCWLYNCINIIALHAAKIFQTIFP